MFCRACFDIFSGVVGWGYFPFNNLLWVYMTAISATLVLMVWRKSLTILSFVFKRGPQTENCNLYVLLCPLLRWSVPFMHCQFILSVLSLQQMALKSLCAQTQQIGLRSFLQIRAPSQSNSQALTLLPLHLKSRGGCILCAPSVVPIALIVLRAWVCVTSCLSVLLSQPDVKPCISRGFLTIFGEYFHGLQEQGPPFALWCEGPLNHRWTLSKGVFVGDILYVTASWSSLYTLVQFYRLGVTAPLTSDWWQLCRVCICPTLYVLCRGISWKGTKCCVYNFCSLKEKNKVQHSTAPQYCGALGWGAIESFLWWQLNWNVSHLSSLVIYLKMWL